MNASAVSVLVGVLAGLGAGLILYSILHFMLDIIEASNLGVSQFDKNVRRRQGKSAPKLNLNSVSFPWWWAYIAAIGLAAVCWAALASWHAQPAAILCLLIPYAVQRWSVHRRQQRIQNESRQFLMDLRLALSAGGTLLPALREMARSGPPLLASLLTQYLSGYSGSGLDVLQRIADESKNIWLLDLCARYSAAEGGTLGADEAVRQSLERVVEESNTRVREQLQKLPNRLTILVFPVLFGPALILWLFPLAARLLASLSGASSLTGGY